MKRIRSRHLGPYIRTITANYQLAIPEPLFRRLGWRPHQRLAIEIRGDEIWVQAEDTDHIGKEVHDRS